MISTLRKRVTLSISTAFVLFVLAVCAVVPAEAATQHFLITIVVGSIGFLSLAWWLLRRETTPLHELAVQMRSLSSRNTSDRKLAFGEHSDINKLVTAFNDMIDQLDESNRELRQSEARFRNAFEQAAVGMCLRDESRILVDVNQSYCDILGYRREEMIGRNPIDFTHPDDISISEDVADRFWKDKKPSTVPGNFRFQKRYVHKNGHTVWVEISSIRLITADGHNLDLGAIVDITDRIEIEHELKRNETRLRIMFEQAGVGMTIRGKHGKWIEVNQHMTEILGYSHGELVGMDPLDITHPEDVDTTIKAFNDFWSLEEETGHITHQKRYRHKDGHTVWVRITTTHLSPADGGEDVMLSFFVDITESVAAEQRLLASEDRFRRLFEQAAVGMMLKQRDGRIIDVNQRMCDLVGYERNELIDIDPSTITHPGDREVSLTTTDKFWSSTGGEVVHRKRYVRKDGASVWVLVSSNRLRQPDGNDLELCVIADISNSVHAEQVLNDIASELEQRVQARTSELEKANKAKSEFLSTVSHELRTPMNAILGFAQLLKVEDEIQLSRTQDDYVNHILDAGYHLLALIDDVLDLARIESERINLTMWDTPAQEIITETLSLAKPIAERYRIQIRDDSPPDKSIYLRVDALRARQALLNLVSNAIKYNRNGGSVHVSWTTHDQNTVRLIVRDTGVGIPADRVHELFQPFSRLGAESSGIEGTGIGLNLTKRLVELMDGSVGVESELGKGSTFWIDLPRGQVPERIKEARTPAGEMASTIRTDGIKTIVYVEDNPINLRLMESVAQRIEGVRLTTAKDAESGLELIRADPPDLLIFDIQLPGISGRDALRILHKEPQLRTIPAIALSADANKDSIRETMEAGFQRYITKPISVPDLIKAVTEMLNTELVSAAQKTG